ncbi:armadillo-type protein [Syncephalis fuscata]|nr:armadillo-type protein [Syncephalis fuscata]
MSSTQIAEQQPQPFPVDADLSCEDNIDQYCIYLRKILSDATLDRTVDNGVLVTIADQGALWGRKNANREKIGSSEFLKLICEIVALDSNLIDETAYVQCLRAIANGCANSGVNRDIVLESDCVSVIISSICGPSETYSIIVVKCVLATLTNLANDHQPAKHKLIELNAMSLVRRWLDLSTLDLEHDGEVATVYATRLAYSLLEESGSIEKFLAADALTGLIPVVCRVLSMEDPSESSVTSIAMEVLQVLTALMAREAVGKSPILFLLLDAIDKINPESKEQDGDDNNNNDDDDEEDYRKLASSILIQTLYCDALNDYCFKNKEFIGRLVNWIKTGNDEQVSIAALALGNLASNDANALALIDDWKVLPYLVNWLKKSDVRKTQYAIIGLLKNLAILDSGPHEQCKAGVIGVLPPLINSPSRSIHSKTVVLLKALTKPSKSAHYTNIKCAVAVCKTGSSTEDSIVGRVLRLLEVTTDDAAKNEAFRFIGHLVRHGWAKEGEDASMKRVRDSLALHPFLPPLVKYMITTRFPMLFNESLVAITLITTHKESFEMVRKVILKPFAIEAEAEADQSSATTEVAESSKKNSVPTITTLLEKLLKVLGDNDKKTPAEYRSNVLMFLEAFIYAGKEDNPGNATVIEAAKEIKKVVLLLKDSPLVDKQLLPRIDGFHTYIENYLNENAPN